MCVFFRQRISELEKVRDNLVKQKEELLVRYGGRGRQRERGMGGGGGKEREGERTERGREKKGGGEREREMPYVCVTAFPRLDYV